MPILRTRDTMGVLGQWPLPEKEPHDLEAVQWRLRRLVGAGQWLAPILRTRHTMGVLGQSPLPEKEPHDLEAVQWR
ncbi:MAG: hypothetical protein WB696_11405, partial [Chthoniobacterales bacterium]